MKLQLPAALLIATSCLSWAVPSEINYQGRLTDASGDPVTGDVSMSIKVFDAPMNGNELYSEDIGAVTLDDNGVYSFQFGASGQSLVNRSEIIAISDGTSTSYNKTLSATPLEKTLAVGDGTYSWDVVNGNPGGVATATATVVNGFVIGVTVGNGGSGYTNPPLVTISGNGTGATASAVVSNGVVTAINIENTGSGYTSATISIANPPTPFMVDYSGGLVSVAYESAPSSGIEIIATYKENDSSIVGALSAAEAHWFELSVDGVSQSPRERVLSVPFASISGSAESASGKLADDISDLKSSLVYIEPSRVGFHREGNPAVELLAGERMRVLATGNSNKGYSDSAQIKVSYSGGTAYLARGNLPTVIDGPASVSSAFSNNGTTWLSYEIIKR
jgi:hypothetical protein